MVALLVSKSNILGQYLAGSTHLLSSEGERELVEGAVAGGVDGHEAADFGSVLVDTFYLL